LKWKIKFIHQKFQLIKILLLSTLNLNKQDIANFIIVGDRVLIKPKKASERTNAGLYLPPSVKENAKMNSGYVVKAGPGYAIPSHEVEEEWKTTKPDGKYIPLQAREGDLAIFFQSSAYKIEFNGEKYVVVPHTSILLLIRDEGLFS